MGESGKKLTLIRNLFAWTKVNAAVGSKSSHSSQPSTTTISHEKQPVVAPDTEHSTPRERYGERDATNDNKRARSVRSSKHKSRPSSSHGRATAEDGQTGAETVPTMTAETPGKMKPSTLAGSAARAFFLDMKHALLHTWINALLVFVPIGIAASLAGLSPEIVFAVNAIAVVPLASLLAYATESTAVRLGDTIGALLNVTFGNAVELIIL